ncbi:hypothetical protein Athai_21170 [Actinocatenispora thailandica]|uniref:Uncharacterized protein n=1 Tax=Actinocatenispora thailandica TaxID=227318 RepID=A0A7R7DMS7_9ACTN|nr:hypothetical protein Athai_21170 [Actinocatenispora thailandica]
MPIGIQAGGPRVPGRERRPVARRPLLRAVLQLVVGALADEQVLGGVVERAEHPGDVAQRRVRQHPLGQRLDRFALEVDQQPAGRGAQRLPEMQVAVDALHRARRRDVGDRGELGPERGRVPGQLRHRAHRLGEPADHRRGQVRLPVGVPLAGTQRGDQVGVHLRDRLAEPARLGGEVAAHLVGPQIRLGEQVPHARGRHRPAVRGVRRVGRQHPVRHGGAEQLAADLAEQRRHVRAADPAQRPVQLHVRVGTRGGAAEQLQDRLLVEHHRRVRLLHLDHPAGQAASDDRVRLRPERQPAVVLAAGQLVEQQVRQLVVPQPGVPDVPADGPDPGVLQPVRQRGAPADQQLVALRLAGRVLHLDDQVVQPRLRVAQRYRRHRGHRLHRPVLAGEPALLGQPAGERGGQRLRPIGRGPPAVGGHDVTSSRGLIWNQKNPCPGSVSR